MPGVTVKAMLQDMRKVQADALIVGFYQDVRPLKGLAGELDWLLCGALSQLLITNKLRGSLGDMALLTSRGKSPAGKIFMMGLGLRAGFTLSALRTAARTAAAGALGAGAASAAIEYIPPSEASHEQSVSAIREGLSEGAAGRPFSVDLIAPDAASYETISRVVKI